MERSSTAIVPLRSEMRRRPLQPIVLIRADCRRQGHAVTRLRTHGSVRPWPSSGTPPRRMRRWSRRGRAGACRPRGAAGPPRAPPRARLHSPPPRGNAVGARQDPRSARGPLRPPARRGVLRRARAHHARLLRTQDRGDDRRGRRVRPGGALQRERRRADHLRRPSTTSPGRTPLRRSRTSSASSCAAPSTPCTCCRSSPTSSDRGFSIVDFEEVDPRLGGWDEIEQLSLRFRMMFDGVFNRVSSKSRSFQAFLNGDPDYRDYFVAFNTHDAIHPDHLRLILRPRTTDLLTPFRTLNGPRFVWTTFSDDQVDLNFAIQRCCSKCAILLFYVQQGATSSGSTRLPTCGRSSARPVSTCRDTPGRPGPARVLDAVAPHVAAHHRDERAARREHLLLRRRHERGADGLQLCAAAAHPARLR